MKIVVFGATGRTGRLVVRGGLARGHLVTAFARDAATASRLLGEAEGLAVARGDVLEPRTVTAAVDGQDAVVYAIGPPTNRRRTTIVSEGVLNVVHAMKEDGVRRLLCLSAWGAGRERDANMPWVYDRVVRPLFLEGAFADLRHTEITVRQSGLEWTLVRPARLVDGPGRGRCRSGPGYTLSGGTRIARADVATFLLDQLDTDVNRGHAVAIAW